MTADERYRMWTTLDRILDMIDQKNIRAAVKLAESEMRALERDSD